MLEEIPSDSEEQSSRGLGLIEDSKTTTCNLPFPVTQCHNEGLRASPNKHVTQTQDVEIVNESSDDKLPKLLPQIKRVSSTYTYVHQELRAMEARVRWSSVRYAFGFQKRSLQEFSFVVPVQGQNFQPDFGSEYFGDSHPTVQLLPRDRLVHRPSGCFTSSVLNIIEHNNGLGIRQMQLSDFGSLGLTISTSSHAEHPPCMQLPGMVQSTPIKALPDIGSSQNIIDADFVQSLIPPVIIQPVDRTSDKPLVAPDGVKIPCTGKVYLSWVFQNETLTHELCFYVVENCSHKVIIGNGFLRETETFEKHQGR